MAVALSEKGAEWARPSVSRQRSSPIRSRREQFTGARPRSATSASAVVNSRRGALLITEGPIHCLDDRLPDLCPHVPLAQPHEPVPVEAFDLPHDLAQMYGVNRPMLFGGEEIKEEYLIEALAA